MRSIQRKLTVLGASALAMGLMAVGASSAQAAVEVYDGHSSELELCPDLVVEGNDVSGGCLVEEMDGGFTGMAGGSVFEVWDAWFDMRIDGDGDWYAVDQGMFSTGWGRQPCKDQETGETIPWLGTTGPLTLEICIEPYPSGTPYSEVVPFDAELSQVLAGNLLSMTQNTEPENGIADAHFENLGDTEEIHVEVGLE